MRITFGYTATMIFAAILLSAGCHRGGREFTMARLEEELRGLEVRTTIDFLSDLYPPYEEWLLLPGVTPPSTWDDTLSVWLESYRIISPDTLKSSDWTRFLRQPGRAEFLSVVGYLEKPRVVPPTGFKGFLVRFRVMGVESSVLLVDRTAMRWLVWLERKAILDDESGYTPHIDSTSARISTYLSSWHMYSDSSRVPSDESDMEELYDDPPPVIIEPSTLFNLACENEQPSIKGVHDGIVYPLTPQIYEHIMNEPPLPDMALLEPEFLQRRLQAMQNAGWPCFHLSDSTVRYLDPGIYIWAEGPYQQLWAVPVETYHSSAAQVVSIGPSALFFGRDVAGAGILNVTGTASGSRITEINTYPFEYGLSPYSTGSIHVAEQAGDFLFRRMGFLLSRITDISEDHMTLRLRTLPVENPAVHGWRLKKTLDDHHSDDQ